MRHTDIRFADIQLLRYEVPEFETLSLQQKKYVYFLSEAALAGRDILWDQNCRLNLPIRRMLEAVYRELIKNESPSGTEQSEVSAFITYLRRVWFANGIHHHYSTDKFRPGFSEQFLRKVLTDIDYPIDEELLRAIFDPTFLPKRVNQTDGADLLLTSAMNYYAPDITQQEAEDYYARIRGEWNGECPHQFGLNSRLERDGEGRLTENVWRSGGMYGPIIDRIIHWLQLAQEITENDEQRQVIATLTDFYRTGDLHTFDQYTIQWVQQTEGDIDFTNGFTEVYGDPLGLKASWEGYVNIRDQQATERTRRLSENAQWFEDHSPTAPEFKKRECRGVTAKVVNVAMLGGDLYPASAIGINLPNSNWVRQHYGSKSVTLGNLTHAYAQAARGNGFYEEFVHPDVLAEFSHSERQADYSGNTESREDSSLITLNPSPFTLNSSLLDDLHTDLHECLGHGSGQLLPGVDPDALGQYGSTIEEARADLFALYFIADPKMQELGLIPDPRAYRIQYYTYIMNGLMTQLVRIEPGQQIEEAHMRNRALIANWLLRHSEGAMSLTLSSSHHHTYLLITDYPVLRHLIGQLLAEVQRIKSEGDYKAARQLVEEYGVKVDPVLHKEILQRYQRLGLAPYKGFINPRLTPVHDEQGNITDITVSYDESYDQQMLRYGKENSFNTKL